MRKFIDSHVHFWNPSQLRYDWLANLPDLNKTFLPDDLPQTLSNWQMEQLVFVQADCAPEQSLDEARWVSELGDERIAGIVAFAALERGAAVRPQLEQLAAIPRVKGVRRLIQSEALGFSTQPDFVAGVQALSGFGLSFDICVLHHQLPDVIELVQYCPDVLFVLDHCGKPDIASGAIDTWRDQITQLATFEHVHCKLSGLVTEADHSNWTLNDLQPYVEHILESFGVKRLMYGGDWPVVKLAADYPKWFEAAQALISTLSETEQDAIFYDNAQRFYRLEAH